MNQAMILCKLNNIELSEYYMIHIHVLYIIYISYIIYVLQTYMYYVSDLIAANLGRNVCPMLQGPYWTKASDFLDKDRNIFFIQLNYLRNAIPANLLNK